jgi:hypothetical protein
MEARARRSTWHSAARRGLQLAGYQDGASGHRAARNGATCGDRAARHSAAWRDRAARNGATCGDSAARNSAACGDSAARGDQDRAARILRRASGRDEDGAAGVAVPDGR